MTPIIQKIWMSIMVLCASLSASAYDFELDGIQYDITSFTDLTVMATSLSDNTVVDLFIPDTVVFNGKTLSVTQLGNSFASDNTTIVSVKVGSNIKSISANAFRNCTSLKKADISSAEQIDASAFLGCSDLTEVILSNTLNKIGANAFSGCILLESLQLPNSVTSIGVAAFQNCKSINHIAISNVKTISASIFYGCSSLDDISLSESLYSIGNNAFSGCAFETFEIPNTVITIGSDILTDCQNLTTLTIGTGLTKIDKNPCRNVPKLENLIILDCDKPLEIAYRGNVYESKRWHEYAPIQTTNDWSTVWFCTTGLNLLPLKNVYIGRNLISSDGRIGYEGAYYTYLLPPLFMHPTIENIEIGGQFSSTSPKRLDLHLDGYVEFNYTNTFGYFENSNLNSILLTGELNSIGDRCFAGTKLVELSIPNTVYEIGDYSFYGCSELINISLGKNISNIGNSSLSSLDNLQKIDLYSMTPPSYSTGFNNNQYINLNVNIPPSTLSEYQKSEPWKNFWNLQEDEKLLSEFTVDPFKYEILNEDNVSVSDFSDYSITSIEIPNSVTYNGVTYSVSQLDFVDKKLSNCEYISLPSSINSLPSNIFEGWDNIISINLGEIKGIGRNAFKGCKALKHINIPGSCVVIGADAFDQCTSLQSVSFLGSSRPIAIEYNSKLTLSNSIAPFPNPTNVDERRTGFRSGYYDGLFYGLPIEHLVINRNIELPKYYERTVGSSTSNYSTIYNDIIYYPPFHGLTNLKSVEIGENVSTICKNQIEAVVNARPITMEYTNFGKCDNIEVVVSNNPNAPIGGSFSQSVYDHASLFLPNGGIESYHNDDYWKKFARISESAFVPIESISFESENMTFDLNACQELHPILNPSDASIKTLRWSSSKPSIVNVSEEGMITTSSRDGEAIITASACDGTNVSASIKIIVQEGAGISDVTADGKLDIRVENDKLFIRGKAYTDIVSIYNVQGQLIISTNDNEIELCNKGIYFIKIGPVCKKIVI